MTSLAALSETTLPELRLLRRGKVRDVYEVDAAQLLIVATDRISAFDCISPTPIPNKGAILTQISCWWFAKLAHIVPNHLITNDIDAMPEVVRQHSAALRGRAMLVQRTEVFPVECVVRGYLAGSGWADYQRTGAVCGHVLPTGLQEAARLPKPLFTPATKAETGHDENISEAQMADILGAETTALLRDYTLRLYTEASAYALTRGIIIADTKFEFGRAADGRILLIDEALTPDSARFWPSSEYVIGRSPASFDKQFVRDYLETLAWSKQPPAPPLPPEIVAATQERYLTAYRLLTGQEN